MSNRRRSPDEESPLSGVGPIRNLHRVPPQSRGIRPGHGHAAAHLALWLILFTGLSAAWVNAEERPLPLPQTMEAVSFFDEKRQRREIEAGIAVEAEDGGLLLLEPDGRLWAVDRPQIRSREKRELAFTPFTAVQLADRLVTDLGPSFEIVSTKHYVIATSAGRDYGEWCGALLERLYAAFHAYWKQRGLVLHEPEFPLPAIVFGSQEEFAAFATQDAGPDVATAKGYFHITTNRMVLYDLTPENRGKGRTAAEINRRLSQSPFNVATIVHEATHQIAFNSGMHTRLADNPLWVTEGMAMFFETPDLTSRTGWKSVGALNTLRHRQFLEGLKIRPPGALKSLIEDDRRLTAGETSGQAYAEAWALTYFLIRTRKTAYVEYLRGLAKKPRLHWDTPQARLEEFQQAFGADLETLDTELLRAMRRIR